MRIVRRSTILLAVIAVAASAASAAVLGGQPNVARQQQATPGSGKGVKIGYISNKEAVPIVHVISVGIREQAKRAGVNFVFCDAAGDTAKALDCAKSFKTQNVQGILNFQHDSKASPSICSAGPSVPTIAIDIPQKPCQVAFMGVDNAYGGMVAGKLLGQYFKSHFNCSYDAWISLEEPEIGAVNEQRMGGYRKGFQTVCPGPIKNLRKVGFDASADQGRSKTADELTSLPGKHHVIVTSIDDEGVEGAFAAARAAGRSTDVWAASLGVADKTSRCGIKTNPNWVAATAIFPEKYGWVGIPYLIKAIKGEKIPKFLYVPLVAVDAKSIGKYYKLSC